MENQHRKIAGYRELNEADVAMMNKIKAHATATEALAMEVSKHFSAQYRATTPLEDPSNPLHDHPRTDAQTAELERLERATPHRWLNIARTDFQTGFMALTRAVAQPTTF